MMKRIFIVLMLFIISIRCNNSITASSEPCDNPLIDSTSIVTCTRVIDGDTWCFVMKNEEIKVRVLNIDCYEIKKDNRLQKQADAAGISLDSALTLGLHQKELANKLLLNNHVKIVRDYSHKNYDVYNRLLRICYVNNQLYDTLIAIK
jgi:endonuclease YncB( thermonuclease family)